MRTPSMTAPKIPAIGPQLWPGALLLLSLPVLAAPDDVDPAAWAARCRCVSNYLFGEGAYDLEAWKRDLDGIKAAGFNTVWMVNVWAAFEPSVEPEEWDQTKLDWLTEVCREVEKRDLTLLFVVAYIGEGWGPRGVDVPVWPLIEKHRQQHLSYLRRMAQVTRDVDHVVYLLCTEEILPATLLYRPNERKECIEAFRAWAKQTNPDIAYWNGRWGTDYTWDTLAPADTKHRPRYQLWVDHNRWFASLMRKLAPPMVEAIREVRPGAVVGFHDFLLDPALKQDQQDRATPQPSPFDFFSTGYYYGKSKSFADNMEALKERISLARETYPDMPLILGETGLPVSVKDADKRIADEALQARWLKEALSYLTAQRIGYSVWNWRAYVPNAETSHSLLRHDGTSRPALDAVRELQLSRSR